MNASLSFYTDIEYLENDDGGTMEGIEDTPEWTDLKEVDLHDAFAKKKKSTDVKSVKNDKVVRKVPNKKMLIKKGTTKVRKTKDKPNVRNFTIEEKKRLAGLIEKQPHIWDLNHKLHSNIYAINSSWKKISLEFPDCKESDCKSVWRSLRNSSRYYNNKKGKTGNTGDSADDEPLEPPEDISQWEFGECMSFLQPMSQKYPRKTNVMGITIETVDQSTTPTSSLQKDIPATKDRANSYIELNEFQEDDETFTERDTLNEQNDQTLTESCEEYSNDESLGIDEMSASSHLSDQSINGESSSSSQSLSNYHYATQSKKKDLLTDSVVDITKGIAELVNCRKFEIKKKQEDAQSRPPENQLKFGYMWANFDQLLQKLPASDVLQLNMDFYNLINEKLKKNLLL